MKETKTIQIEVPADKKAEWQEVGGKTVLVMVDEKDNRPVTERIKTFDDACNELGDEHPLVTQYRLIYGAYKNDPVTEDLIAYLKLRIITAALNEGCGSRLTFKSEKLAAYAGRQFAEIYADFCFKPKS